MLIEIDGLRVLTVSGLIGKSNRGPVDPALDQLMVKHGVKFDKTYVFDAKALRCLPSVRIRPTLECDARMHTLSGPLLTRVLEAAGVPPGGEVMLGLQAVDGYAVPLRMADARRYRMIVATGIDGGPAGAGRAGSAVGRL